MKISEELLIKILGDEYSSDDDYEIIDDYLRVDYADDFYYTIDINGIERKCREWAKEEGYYLRSGFNTCIIADNGRDIDYDYKIVDRYSTDIYRIVFDGKKVTMEKVAFVGDDKSSEIKACQWILDNKED